MKYTLHIEQDNDAQSPREWDNLGTIAAFRVQYNFDEAGITMEEAQDIAKSKDWVSLPVYLYDHSGLSVSTTGFSCRLDGGQLGIIYVSKEKALKEFDWKVLTKARRERLTLCLEEEIKELDQYLTGDVYGYVIKDEDGDVVEYCWGFYGEEYCKKEGEAVLERVVKEADKHEAQKQADIAAAYAGL